MSRGGFRWQFLLLFTGICLACQVQAASPRSMLDALKLPEQASLQLISNNSVSNGRHMLIAAMESPQSRARVASFFRQQWADSHAPPAPGFVEHQMPDWQIISRLHDGYLIVVQLSMATQNTSGFVSITSLKSVLLDVDTGVFNDLELLSSHRTVDGVDTSVLNVYGSSSSVTQTLKKYRQRLLEKGWQVFAEASHEGARVAVMVRGDTRLELSFVPSANYASAVVAHSVTSD